MYDGCTLRFSTPFASHFTQQNELSRKSNELILKINAWTRHNKVLESLVNSLSNENRIFNLLWFYALFIAKNQCFSLVLAGISV
jgi:hypothetical protein